MTSSIPVKSADRPERIGEGADHESINSSIRYAMFSVFATTGPLPGERGGLAEEALQALTPEGVVLRGVYDVSGLRADADLMTWTHAENVESLQAAYNAFRATHLGRHLTPVWSVVSLHRPAEFNKRHVPDFLAGNPARRYLCVYPFVRSYEWYVLEEGERSEMLREHGFMARDYPDVRANTMATFALSDYEFILPFEADELYRIVDLMRELRAAKARLHVREETPFYTGPRVELADLVARLP